MTASRPGVSPARPLMSFGPGLAVAEDDWERPLVAPEQ